jgi:hypothetical protein
MPDGSPSFERWRALGRVLPGEVRERVFDPAFTDLVRAWLTRSPDGSGAPFWVSAIGTYLGCVPIAVPHFFVRRGRLTRLGKGLVWTASGLTLVWLVLVRMASSYATSGTRP